MGDAASFKGTISPTLNEAPSPVPAGTSAPPTDLALLLLLLALIID